jgi:hypothetical protein
MNNRPVMTPALIIETYQERKRILQEQLDDVQDKNITEQDRRHWRSEIARCDRIIVQQKLLI